MSDIRLGKIMCLVVRDLSRFGKDYIETGTYLERVFPQIGLRFISVKERYDSFDSDGDSLIIPLQNMINALYSKDISRKVSTALHAKIAAGTYKSGNLPYGYRWSENHDNMIPDELTAPIVQNIFRWTIEGISNSEILDSEEYGYAKKAFDGEYSDLSRRLDEAVQRKNSFSEAMSENNKWIKLMKSVGNAKRLTQELVDESIVLVKVHEGCDIELTMKYKDIYELTYRVLKMCRR